MNCNTTHYRANSSSVPGDPTAPLLVVHDVEKGVAPATPDYRLTGELSANRRLRLRLWQGDEERLIWSWQAPLPPSGATAGLLAPPLAELVQPYGVIATRERTDLATSFLPGYPCLLQFDGYRRARTAALHRRVRACLEASTAIERARPYAFAALALLAIDEKLYGFNPEAGDPEERAFALGRSAVAADPFLGRAHHALARAYFARRQWPEAARSARRAAALSPLDPDLLALMAAILANVRAPDAEAVARRALALDPNAPASFYAPLVYVALLNGDFDAARQAADQMVPSPGASAPLYELVIAVVRAGSGDQAGARAAWARLVRAMPEVRDRPRAAFERWDFAPPLEAVSWRALAKAGLVPPQPRAGGSL